MYNTTQSLIADDKISAGHDISDGGMAVTLLEAAFAGNCGIQVPASSHTMRRMFCTSEKAPLIPLGCGPMLDIAICFIAVYS